jgi:hypothetical protein
MMRFNKHLQAIENMVAREELNLRRQPFQCYVMQCFKQLK